MSYMDRLKAKITETCLPSQPTKLTEPGFVSFVSDPSGHVFENVPPPPPPDLVAGIAFLKRRRPPRIADPAAWTAIVADAESLVTDGWAAQALDLGWTLHDLFGVGPKDSWEYSGLAVWLEGRSVLMLDEHIAAVRTETGQAYFERGGWGHGRDADVQPVLLWAFGQ